MLQHPQFDPYIFNLGPINIGSFQMENLGPTWYGFSYLIGISLVWWLCRKRAAERNLWKPQQIDDLIFYAFLGVIIGGRLGYKLFYDFAGLAQDPMGMIRIWEGGMSFHGGLIGVLLAVWYFGRSTGKSFFEVGDFVAPMAPLALACGRVGNFINGELWGRVADPSLPWGMVFAGAGSEPRHPSQLYQMAGEGLALFFILWFYSKKPRPKMAVSGAFLIGYGFFRFMVEFFRQPDSHLGFVALGWMSRGQQLSLPMIAVGAMLMVMGYRLAKLQTPAQKASSKKSAKGKV
ncbi:prolipoprotein diacylglyceryl transferase [Pelagibaculum spongiae]|uniref:Phosphatidylglycerol--prolipoprotein diacylglyceryl transferase n=1 Tax=Pelagibaculum spongiae TaxID=2080658 RepID=A0A2V1H6J9_9GAMM|nr:prolipoprotein diacylglyceryl transferase [Pelagibaculum spongiae]PVZ72395.1 prolipoprotein diacylglyceryl transferase [Pelagibaculum spongiae]